MKSLTFFPLILVSLLWMEHVLALRISSGVIPRRRAPPTCDLPSLPNGKVLRRSKGKMLQYLCNSPYKLIGSKYATCKNRQWDSPVPICAKSGCPDISTPELKDHMVFYENNKIMVTLRCRSEYILKGASVAYCDGENWDRALGMCHPSAGIDNLSCDFESEDLCGWSHDENEDFRWVRRSGQPTTLRQRTGPRSDHTTGRLHEGHYMLLESFEHEEGDRALFFSPIYSAEKSKDSCVKFFYHMYGLMVGSLMVYVKPVSIDIDSLYSDIKFRFFDKKANQGNIWHEARFQMEELEESFQIIFEGVLRSSLFGDIAIDDVELLQGDECLPDPVATTTEAVEVEVEDNFAVILSCENRCGEQSRSNKSSGSCDCHNDCTDSYSCCPDFGKVCLSSDTPPTTTTTPKTTTTTRRTSTKQTTKMSQKSGAPREIRPTATSTRKPSLDSTSELVEPVETRFKILPKALDDNEMPPGFEIVSMHKTVIFISIVGCLSLALIVTMLLVRHYQQRRRIDPEFYKKRQEGSNASHSSAREEFSEIRYLTQDEHLDFSLASPTSFRPQQVGSSLAAVPKPGHASNEDRTTGNGSDQENEEEEEVGTDVGGKKTKKKKANINSKSSTPKNGKKVKSSKKTYKDDPDNEGLLLGDEDGYEEW